MLTIPVHYKKPKLIPGKNKNIDYEQIEYRYKCPNEKTIITHSYSYNKNINYEQKEYRSILPTH